MPSQGGVCACAADSPPRHINQCWQPLHLSHLCGCFVPSPAQYWVGASEEEKGGEKQARKRNQRKRKHPRRLEISPGCCPRSVSLQDRPPDKTLSRWRGSLPQRACPPPRPPPKAQPPSELLPWPQALTLVWPPSSVPYFVY